MSMTRSRSFQPCDAPTCGLFERASDADLARIGMHSERGEESLGYMLKLYAGHDIVHLRQIERIRRAVGAA